MRAADKLFKRRFQFLNFRPHDVLTVIQHTLYTRADLVLQGRILGFEVDELHLF